MEVGFRSKEVLFLSCGKHDHIIVHCHIVHRKVCFLGTFVNAHLVVHCVDGVCYVVISVHCVGVPHVISVIIVLLQVLIIMLLLLLLLIIFLMLVMFLQVFMVLLVLLTFLHATTIVNDVVGAHHVTLSLFVITTTLIFTLSYKLELH